MWGIFRNNAEVHVIPVDDEDNMKSCHTQNRFCVCSPVVEIKPGSMPLIIHNEEN